MLKQVILDFVQRKVEAVMQGQQVNHRRNDGLGQIEGQMQKEALKVLSFLSGALQLVPLDLCASLTPLLISFSEIQDPKIKLNSYLALEVLFASRRFGSDGGHNLVGFKTLKHLLDYAEILSVVDLQADQEGAQNIRFDKQDEIRVVAYI